MKRLSLEELKAKAGKNVISNVESINGGDERPPIRVTVNTVAVCDNA